MLITTVRLYPVFGPHFIMGCGLLCVVLISCCPWQASGEWYHLNEDSGHSAAPDVIMSMTDITVDSDTSGTFFYTKDGATEQGNITRTEATLLESNLRGSGAPGFNVPSMSFDGKTFVTLGDHTDSCFDNLEFCPQGWTIGFWLKAPSQSAKTIFDSGAYTYDRGASMFIESPGKAGITMVTNSTHLCSVKSKSIPVDEWFYVMFSLDNTECEFTETSNGSRSKTTSNPIRDPRTFQDSRRFLLGTISRTVDSFFGTFSLDELTVWYQRLDTERDGSVFLSQTALASVCGNDGDCSSVEYSHCSRKARWGTDSYCQCLSDVSYEDHTYNGTTLTSLTPACTKPPPCPRLTVDDIASLIKKRKAMAIP